MQDGPVHILAIIHLHAEYQVGRNIERPSRNGKVCAKPHDNRMRLCPFRAIWKDSQGMIVKAARLYEVRLRLPNADLLIGVPNEVTNLLSAAPRTI